MSISERDKRVLEAERNRINEIAVLLGKAEELSHLLPRLSGSGRDARTRLRNAIELASDNLVVYADYLDAIVDGE